MKKRQIADEKFILEVCVDSVESALITASGGADRIELCQNLIIGGTTPSPKLFEEIRKLTNIKTHILIRPRFGDFCYSNYEIDLMKEEVRMFQSLGAEGIVIGIINPDGTLNSKEMEKLICAAEGMSITLHRAFDMTIDPLQAMKDGISLGIDSILTSGQRNKCMDGMPLLKTLQNTSDGQIEILVGAGVSGNLIPDIYRATGIKAYHMSGKIDVGSKMNYRKKEVSMGLENIGEYVVYQTSMEEIKKATRIIKTLNDNKEN